MSTDERNSMSDGGHEIADRLRDSIGQAQELVRLARQLNGLIEDEQWEELEALIQKRGIVLEKLRGVPSAGEITGSADAERLWQELSGLLRETFSQDRATKELLDSKLSQAADDAAVSRKGMSLLRAYRSKGTKGSGTWLDFSK
jgi:hypothetical protein